MFNKIKNDLQGFKAKAYIAANTAALAIACPSIAYADIGDTAQSTMTTILSTVLGGAGAISIAIGALTGALAVRKLMSDDPQDHKSGMSQLAGAIGGIIAGALVIGLKGTLTTLLNAAIGG